MLAADPYSVQPAFHDSKPGIAWSRSFITYLVTCADDPVTSMDVFDIPNQPEMFHTTYTLTGIKFVTGCNAGGPATTAELSDVPSLMHSGIDPERRTGPGHSALNTVNWWPPVLQSQQCCASLPRSDIQRRHPCGQRSTPAHS